MSLRSRLSTRRQLWRRHDEAIRRMHAAEAEVERLTESHRNLDLALHVMTSETTRLERELARAVGSDTDEAD